MLYVVYDAIWGGVEGMGKSIMRWMEGIERSIANYIRKSIYRYFSRPKHVREIRRSVDIEMTSIKIRYKGSKDADDNAIRKKEQN